MTIWLSNAFRCYFFSSHFMNFRLSDIVYLFLKMLLAAYLNKLILKFKLIRNESVDNSFIQLCFDRQMHKAQNEMFVKISKKLNFIHRSCCCCCCCYCNWFSFDSLVDHFTIVMDMISFYFGVWRLIHRCTKIKMRMNFYSTWRYGRRLQRKCRIMVSILMQYWCSVVSAKRQRYEEESWNAFH